MTQIALQQLEGKYEILGKMRQGGMGAIYKVRHRLLGDVRVIKVMRAGLVEDPVLSKRFLLEARNAIRLSHPNIAQLYDYTLSDDGTAYIVMEFIQGITFQQLLERSLQLPIGLALEMASQSLRAIGHLHQNGVIHRDISPDNLMLGVDVDHRPLVKLIDLGIAKTVGADADLTDAGVFVGKLRYAAPEQFDERGESLTPACDLYGFAIVLYELLTGCYPIVGSGPSSLIAGHLFRPPLGFSDTDPGQRIPYSIRGALLRGLEKSPSDRFDTARSFSDALLGGDIELRWDDPLSTDIIALTQRTTEFASTEDPARAAPGSTQGRLDQEFVAQPTPSRPSQLTSLPNTTQPSKEELQAIEDRISGGENQKARQLLDLCLDRHGRGVQLEELDRRISEMESVALRARLQELVARAAEFSADRNHDQALEVLGQAHELDPGNTRILELLSDARLAASHFHDSAATTKLIDRHAAEVTRLISHGNEEAAATALRKASATFGPDQRLTDLENTMSLSPTVVLPAVDLDTNRENREPAAIEEMVTRAHQLAQHEDFAQAEALLETALDTDPEHTAATALISAVRSCSLVQRAEVTRQQAVDKSVTGIQSLLEEGKTGDAITNLSDAVERFGNAEELQDLRYAATQQELRQAQESTLGSMLESIEARRREGDTGGAMALLQRAQRVHGAVEELRVLRQRLGEELLMRETREISKTDQVSMEIANRKPSQELTALERGSPAAVRIRSDGPAAPGSPRKTPPEVTRSSRPPLPETRSGNKMLGSLAVVLLLGATLYAVTSFDLASLFRTEPTEVAVEPPVDLTPGFLAFDAQPWGEILSLTNLTTEEEAEIIPSRFSPTRISLTAGTYRLTFRTADGGQQELEVTVESGRTTHQRWSADVLTVDGYFSEFGW